MENPTPEQIRKNIDEWNKSQERKKLTKSINSLNDALEKNTRILQQQQKKNISILDRYDAINEYVAQKASPSSPLIATARGKQRQRKTERENVLNIGDINKELDKTLNSIKEKLDISSKINTDVQEKLEKSIDSSLSKLSKSTKESIDKLTESIDELDETLYESQSTFSKVIDGTKELFSNTLSFLKGSAYVAAPVALGAGTYYGLKALEQGARMPLAPARAGIGAYRFVRRQSEKSDSAFSGVLNLIGLSSFGLGNVLLPDLPIGEGGNKYREERFTKEGISERYRSLLHYRLPRTASFFVSPLRKRFGSASELEEGIRFTPSEDFEEKIDEITSYLDPKQRNIKDDPQLRLLQEQTDLQWVAITGGSRYIPTTRKGKMAKNLLEGDKPVGIAKSISKSMDKDNKKKYKDLYHTFLSGFGIKASIGYALPVFGLGYRAELPSPKMSIFPRIARIGELTYVAIRFMSQEINDLLIQIGEFIRIGFGIKGRMKPPKGRSVSQIVGGIIRSKIGDLLKNQLQQTQTGENLLKFFDNIKKIQEEQYQKFSGFFDQQEEGGKPISLLQLEELKNISKILSDNKKSELKTTESHAEAGILRPYIAKATETVKIHKGEFIASVKTLSDSIQEGVKKGIESIQEKYRSVTGSINKKITEKFTVPPTTAGVVSTPPTTEVAYEKKKKGGFLSRIFGGIGGALMSFDWVKSVVKFFREAPGYLRNIYSSLTGADAGDAAKSDNIKKKFSIFGILSRIYQTLKNIYESLSKEVSVYRKRRRKLKAGLLPETMMKEWEILEKEILENYQRTGDTEQYRKDMDKLQKERVTLQLESLKRRIPKEKLKKTFKVNKIIELLPEWVGKGASEGITSFKEKVLTPIAESILQLKESILSFSTGLNILRKTWEDPKSGFLKVISTVLKDLIYKPFKNVLFSTVKAIFSLSMASYEGSAAFKKFIFGLLKEASDRYVSGPVKELSDNIIDFSRKISLLEYEFYEILFGKLPMKYIEGYQKTQGGKFRKRIGGLKELAVGGVEETKTQAVEIGKSGFNVVKKLVSPSTYTGMEKSAEEGAKRLREDINQFREKFFSKPVVKDKPHVSGPGIYVQGSVQEAHIPLDKPNSKFWEILKKKIYESIVEASEKINKEKEKSRKKIEGKHDIISRLDYIIRLIEGKTEGGSIIAGGSKTKKDGLLKTIAMLPINIVTGIGKNLGKAVEVGLKGIEKYLEIKFKLLKVGLDAIHAGVIALKETVKVGFTYTAGILMKFRKSILTGIEKAIKFPFKLFSKTFGIIKETLLKILQPLEFLKKGFRKVKTKLRETFQGELIGVTPDGQEIRSKYAWKATYSLIERLIDEQWELGYKTFLLHKTFYLAQERTGDIKGIELDARGRPVKKAKASNRALEFAKNIFGTIGGMASTAFSKVTSIGASLLGGAAIGTGASKVLSKTKDLFSKTGTEALKKGATGVSFMKSLVPLLAKRAPIIGGLITGGTSLLTGKGWLESFLRGTGAALGATLGAGFFPPFGIILGGVFGEYIAGTLYDKLKEPFENFSQKIKDWLKKGGEEKTGWWNEFNTNTVSGGIGGRTEPGGPGYGYDVEGKIKSLSKSKEYLENIEKNIEKQRQAGKIPNPKLLQKAEELRGRIGSLEKSIDAGNLGSLSAAMEGGLKGTSAIGSDPVGGASYGTYQVSTKTGKMDQFLDYLKTENPEAYAQLAPLKGDMYDPRGQFAQKWKELVSKGTITQETENKFMKKDFDTAALNIKGETGLDVSTRSKALQQVLFSTAVQHGTRGAAKIFSKALSGKDLSKLSDEEIIQLVYEERGRRSSETGELVHFKSSPRNIQESVARRFQKEKLLATNLYSKEKEMESTSPKGTMTLASATTLMPDQKFGNIKDISVISQSPTKEQVASEYVENERLKNQEMLLAMNEAKDAIREGSAISHAGLSNVSTQINNSYNMLSKADENKGKSTLDLITDGIFYARPGEVI